MSDRHVCDILDSRSCEITPTRQSADFLKTLQISVPMVYLSVGSRCNHSCRYCIFSNKERYEEPFKNIQETIAIAAKVVPGAMLNIIGGEPTIRGDFFSIVEEAQKTGFDKIGISSNGINFNNEALIGRLVEEYGVYHYYFSLDSHIPERQNWFSQNKSTWARLSSALDAVLSRPETVVGLNTVVCKPNIDEIPDTIDYIMELERRYNKQIPLVLSALKQIGSAVENREDLWLSMSELAVGLDRAIKYARSIGKTIGCLHMVPCLLRDSAETIIELHMSLDQVWVENGKIQRIEALPRDTERVSHCRDCLYFEQCPGVYREYLEANGDSEFVPVFK